MLSTVCLSWSHFLSTHVAALHNGLLEPSARTPQHRATAQKEYIRTLAVAQLYSHLHIITDANAQSSENDYYYDS